MINRAELKNFGPIKELDWQNLGRINLIIGKNDCGKSFLLKALYSAVRTIEDYKRGDNPDTAKEILADKLFWTFQTEKIGDLVTALDKNTQRLIEEKELSHLMNFENTEEVPDINLSFKLTFNQKNFSYSFDKDTIKTINSLENQVISRADNSVFLPPKEVLSLSRIILEARKNFQFGFDETYSDLAQSLLKPPKVMVQNLPWNASHTIVTDGATRLLDKGVIHKEIDTDPKSTIKGFGSVDFNNSRKFLANMIGGQIEYNDIKERWYFKKGEQRFSIGATAEGIKKIAILDTLLGNGYLNENSIIFIDEPESNLHPEAISKLLDIIAILANHDIQFFMASHSYFVIKKLFLIAQEQQLSIPVLSYQDNEWVQSDLKDEMPSNPIIKESIRLYKEEVSLALK